MPSVDREPVENHEEALEHFSKAQIYFRCLEINSPHSESHGEPLDIEYTADDAWVAKGEYRPDGEVLERFTITKHPSEELEHRVVSFDIEIEYTDPGYGADQLGRLDIVGREVPIPGVNSIQYQVYLNGEGFQVEITEVGFDWDGADDSVLQTLDGLFSDDGLAAPFPGSEVQLQRIARKTNAETFDNLLFTLESLEPASPTTSSS